MTERLYYLDSHCLRFTAVVTGCEPSGDGWAVTLDRTAFFPEGGGQPADTGRIGEAMVRDVQERDGEIWHTTDRPVAVGTAVEGVLDAEQRLRRMQNHSGEHIVSGLAHRLFAVDNVGFHMGADGMTVDFNRELTAEELQQLERAANETVRANVPIRCWFPAEDELHTLDYRSKKELSGAVRLVEIEGVDLCACCAPHVSHTGEVGLIKLLDAQRHRGGVRITLICGMDAYDAVCRMQQSVTAVSQALSVPREKIAEGVARQLGENARQKERIAALSLELVRLRAAASESVEGNHVVFDDTLDEVALRELVNLLMDKCGGLAAAFSGSDASGYRYIIGSKHVDLRAKSKAINAAISGRGGGKPEMIQGSCTADAATIRAALDGLL